MIRPSTIFWLAIVAVLGFSLFRVKYEVQALEDDLTRIRRDTVLQQEALHVLRAEWTYLNQADRLVALSAKFLTLSPLTSAQIATIDQLPLRPAGAPPIVQPQQAPASLVAPTLVARGPVAGGLGAGGTVAGAPARGLVAAAPPHAAAPAAAALPLPPRPAAPSATAAHSTAVVFRATAPSGGTAP